MDLGLVVPRTRSARPTRCQGGAVCVAKGWHSSKSGPLFHFLALVCGDREIPHLCDLYLFQKSNLGAKSPREITEAFGLEETVKVTKSNHNPTRTLNHVPKNLICT